MIIRRNMVKSYLIDGKSISSNSQYRGTALRAISRSGVSCAWSLILYHPPPLIGLEFLWSQIFKKSICVAIYNFNKITCTLFPIF